jgi:hypothetical protein
MTWATECSISKKEQAVLGAGCASPPHNTKKLNAKNTPGLGAVLDGGMCYWTREDQDGMRKKQADRDAPGQRENGAETGLEHPQNQTQRDAVGSCWTGIQGKKRGNCLGYTTACGARA